MKQFTTKNAHQTLELGKNLARQLRGGEVIALTGELGAGKTTLVKGIAAGLGIKRPITSPTFLLLRVYRVREQKNIRQFIHVDAYRVKHPAELFDVGLDNYLGRPDTVTVIEWAERVRTLLPKRRIDIRLKLGTLQNYRQIVRNYD